MKKNPTDKQKKKRQIEGRLIEGYNRKKDTTDIQKDIKVKRFKTISRHEQAFEKRKSQILRINLPPSPLHRLG